jgi:hypothetical protein
MNEMGGTRGVLKGNLKRRLLSSTIMTFSPGEAGSGVENITLQISGLCNLLDLFVGVGAYQITAEGNKIPLPAASWPAGGGTVQLVPQTNFPDSPKIDFRPVFQDPTTATNTNNPQPEELPFSWNIPGECDEALIQIALDRDAWQGSGLTGGVMVQVFAEYFGPWWDEEAFRLAMGQITLSAPNKPIVFTT